MAKSVQGARMQSKRSITSGDIPTIPPNNDHTFGWEDTDIYLGEFYINITDERIFTRCNTGIREFTLLDPSTGQVSTGQTSVPIINNTPNAILMSTGGTESIHAIPDFLYDSSTMTLSFGGNDSPTLRIATTKTNSEQANLELIGARTSSTTNETAIIKMGTRDTGEDKILATIETVKETASTYQGNLVIKTNDGTGVMTEGFRMDKNGSVNFPVGLQLNGTTVSVEGHFHDSLYLGINAIADDSELLDGVEGASYLRSDENDTYTKILKMTGLSPSTTNTKFITMNNSDELEEQEFITSAGENYVLTSNSTGSQAVAYSSLIYNGLSLTIGGNNFITAIGKGEIALFKSGGNALIHFQDGGSYVDIINDTLTGTKLLYDFDGNVRFMMDGPSGIFYSAGGATNPIPPSDIRLKNIESNLTTTLDNILKLDTIKYTWKYHKTDKGNHIGLIAQDVEKYFPDVVKELKQPFYSNDDKEYKSINYTEFVPIIINSMKEQQVIIDDLKKEIQLLKINNI